MRNALILAAAGVALVIPLATWAAESSNDVPVYDPYQSYSLVVTNVSTLWVGPVAGPAAPELVVAQIAEPGSIILLLTGLGALAYSIRRRKRLNENRGQSLRGAISLLAAADPAPPEVLQDC